MASLMDRPCWTFGLLVFYGIASKSGVIFGVLKCFLPCGDTTLSPGQSWAAEHDSSLPWVCLVQPRSPETREKAQEGSGSPLGTAGKHCRWKIPFLQLLNCWVCWVGVFWTWIPSPRSRPVPEQFQQIYTATCVGAGDPFWLYPWGRVGSTWEVLWSWEL